MRPPALLRTFSLTIVAGAVAGAIAGIGARVAMRLAAWLAGPTRAGVLTAEKAAVGDVTWSGTIAVVMIGVFVGISGAALYAALRPALPVRHRGLAFGAAALALVGWTILDPANTDFHRFGSKALNYAMFASVFLVYGISLVATERRLAARAPIAWWSYALWVPIALVGAAMMILGFVFSTDRHPILGLVVLVAIGLASVLARWGPAVLAFWSSHEAAR